MSEELFIASTNKLDIVSKEITEKIVDSSDPEELNELVSIFNLNQKKRNIVRADILSRLLDKVSIQMVDRLDKHSGEFSNKDLLDYLSTVRNALDKNDVSIEESELKPIIAQQNNVNVNITTLDRESRERVSEAVLSLLKQANGNLQDIDFTDLEEEE